MLGEMPQPIPPPPVPPRVWTVALATSAVFAGIVGISLVLGLFFLDGSSRDPLPLVLGELLLLAAATGGWIAAVSLGASFLSPEGWRSRLGLLGPRPRDAGTLVAAIAGGIALSQAIDLLFRLGGGGRGASIERMVAILEPARGAGLVAAVLVLGLGAGFAEELFFRGYAQRRLVARAGAVPGIVAAAALFALAHFDPQHSLFAFVFGLYLGAIAAWTRSTWPPIAVHAVNNGTAVLVAAAGFDDAFTRGSPWLEAALAAALLAAAAGALLVVRRRSRAAAAGLTPPRAPDTVAS